MQSRIKRATLQPTISCTSLLSDSDALNYLGVNRYQDILWFNKEAFEDLMWWLFIIAAVEISVTAR